MESGDPVSDERVDREPKSAHPESAEMPYRLLGRTGQRVSAIGLGGWHIGFKILSEALSVRIIRSAIDRGINFLDNSWNYHRMSPLRAESANVCRHHWHRQ